MKWEIFATALIFAAGIVAYFEMASANQRSSLPPQAVAKERYENRTTRNAT